MVDIGWTRELGTVEWGREEISGLRSTLLLLIELEGQTQMLTVLHFELRDQKGKRDALGEFSLQREGRCKQLRRLDLNQ
jgi:hypothetical protein